MTKMNRRHVTGLMLAFALPWAHAKQTLVEVWKSPDCGCCKDWVKHLQANGFAVRVHDTGNTDARATLRMPLDFASCHTAKVGDYAVEGHVPAREVHRLLKERPDAIGLAVPAMPLGSPGMDGPEYGGRKTPYDVLLVLRDGSSRAFQSYRADVAMTDGEVRKVDREAKKITIKHGEIKNLEMPAMTMVFQVKDPALLDKVKAGDKVRFTAEKDAGGAFVVTALESVKQEQR